MMTAIYSVLHLLVDGLCALAMFGSFLTGENGYFNVLLYNFCAFALQMPLGALLDMIEEKVRRFDQNQGACTETEGIVSPAFLTAAAGVLCTIVGAAVHPALLGLGNALFHVGGGVGCIRQDNAEGWKGRGLGVFVAPGALGLWLGTWLGQPETWKVWYGAVSIGMAVLCAGAVYCQRHSAAVQSSVIRREGEKKAWENILRYSRGERRTVKKEHGKEAREATEKRQTGLVRLWICCVLVVILRSYLGMAVVFPWKTGAAAGAAAVVALAFGKAAGGFGAARYGARKAAVVSLGLAAIGYLFSAVMPIGLTAVFLFNMTMPVTLYWMVCSMPRMPGLAFGILTFALFLGFLPGYFGLLPQEGGNLTGCGGCVVTLLLLVFGIGTRRPAGVFGLLHAWKVSRGREV